MIRITINSTKSSASSRINKQEFEQKASVIFNTIVKNQINESNKSILQTPKVNSKNCNNPI